MRFKNPNRSRITKNKIAALFDRIVRRNSERDRGSIFDILTDLFIDFKRFFTKAKSPRFQFSPLTKGDVVVAEKYNDTILDAMEDLSVCTDETNAIKPIVVGSYNAARQMGKELENRSEVALSKITDVRLFQGQLGQEILVVGDDFQNTKRVDGTFALSAPSADVRTADGLVTLNRIESVNLVDGGTNVSCKPIAPSSILTDDGGFFEGDIEVGEGTVTTITGDTGQIISQNVDQVGVQGGIPDTDNTNRYYEGNFYNFMGEARPEGGEWHIDERPYHITDEQLNTSQTFNTTDEEFSANEVGYTPGTALGAEDILLFDRGASQAEKNTIRRRMFDENSASFWEAEYVKKIEQTPGAEEFSLDDLRDLAIQEDVEDFEIQITVDLGRVKPVSWVSLEPINFGETAWMEITDVSTAGTESEGFKTIPGMYKHRFANVLTDEANEELQADIAAQVLSPDRYSFRGKGVFSFPMTFARYVRLKIVQKVPVPALYQRLTIQMVKEIDTTITVRTTKRRLWKKKRTTTKTSSKTVISRLVKLNYLQTVDIYNNNSTANEFSPETAGTSRSGGPPEQRSSSMLGAFSKKVQTTISSADSGWRMNKEWLEVNYDKMRYAIGIRELSVFNYKFSPTSELVSKRFSSPKEIIKAQLEVVEEIPAEFSPEMRYIEYYISFNDGDWHRINPTGHPTLYSNEGDVVPEILTVNFETSGPGGSTTIKAITTEMPAKQVRLRAIMKNDPSLANPEYYTPVLKKYRVKLVPKTSLSRG